MVFVKGGSFYMGSNDPDADLDEKDIRLVSVGDFYISRYEVTQSEWNEIMRCNLSCFRGSSLPVECVSWDDVMMFIERLNRKTGRHYRLPTYEEWEYAAKGGEHAVETEYSGGDCLDDIAWSSNNSKNETHRVGRLKPNILGIYDMTGNVHEWCYGKYDSLAYAQDTLLSKTVNYSDIRVFKGGSWASDAIHCRISNFNYNSRETRNFSIGFRLAEDVSKK